MTIPTPTSGQPSQQRLRIHALSPNQLTFTIGSIRRVNTHEIRSENLSVLRVTMSNAHLSAMPMDPYQWRESVLSTRSLSYLSTADALGSPGLTTQSRSGSLSYFTNRARRNTIDSDSDYDLEMSGTGAEERELNAIPELPDSVANSVLFTLPREIRDRIYSFSMTTQNFVPIEWPPLSYGVIPYGIQPQLLRTCRIIHEEVAPLLYSLNIMTFHHPSDANMFVRAFASTLR